MADRPIVFSAPMIRALLEGRKTQTRRVMKSHLGPIRFYPDDRLWVREAWRTPDNWNRAPAEIVASCQEAGWKQAWCPIQFEADQSRVNWGDWREHGAGRLRAGMHLPRAFSRLTLIVTGVKVERLHDISEADAEAEGVVWESADPPFYYVPGIFPHSRTAVGIEEPGSSPHAVRSYAKLWEEINGAGSWDENPWVAGISFRVIKANIDQIEASP